MPDELTGLISNIQRFAIHDGPGIRTLVFMKGCPLRCLWCDNPETQENEPRVSYTSSRCIRCGKCAEVCPSGAIVLLSSGRPKTNYRLCQNCGKCIQVCFSGARRIVGKHVTIEELLAEIARDSVFYRNSGGGLTVGGGEPCRQANFVSQLLRRAKEEYYLHTAIETSGLTSIDNLKQVIQYTDLVYYDIKHMDNAKHQQLTRSSNGLILGNLERIASEKSPIIVRVPTVTCLTDSAQNVRAIADFVKRLGSNILRIELLPYHSYGASKYAQLGRRYNLKNVEPPSEEHMTTLKEIVESCGLRVQIGG
ncbi:glycyl-radical enzyme activating protein [Chloroflexota bacterium]